MCTPSMIRLYIDRREIFRTISRYPNRVHSPTYEAIGLLHSWRELLKAVFLKKINQQSACETY